MKIKLFIAVAAITLSIGAYAIPSDGCGPVYCIGSDVKCCQNETGTYYQTAPPDIP